MMETEDDSVAKISLDADHATKVQVNEHDDCITHEVVKTNEVVV